MSYSEQLDALGESVADQVQQLHEQHEAGELDRDTFVELALVLVLLGMAQAAALSELSLTAQLAAAGVADPFPRVVIRPDPAGREARARAALHEALSAPPEQRTERLRMESRSETLRSGSESYSGAVSSRSDEIAGWTRGLNVDACQLCRWWHREGRVWPSDHPMPQHKGCLCAPVVKMGGRPARPVATEPRRARARR